MIWPILLELDREDLKSACATNRRINEICSTAGFQREWNKLHKPRENPGQPMIISYDERLYNAVITSIVKPGLVKAVNISTLTGTLDLKKLDRHAYLYKKDPYIPVYHYVHYDPKTEKCTLAAVSQMLYMTDKPIPHKLKLGLILHDYLC